MSCNCDKNTERSQSIFWSSVIFGVLLGPSAYYILRGLGANEDISTGLGIIAGVAVFLSFAILCTWIDSKTEAKK